MYDSTWFVAFVVMPIMVLCIGYGGVLLHERALRRDDERAAKDALGRGER